MRALITTSLGALTAATLLVPTAAPATATTSQLRPPGGTTDAETGLPGSTLSLPLAPSGTSERVRPAPRPGRAGTPHEAVLARRVVMPFSLLGVVWDDPRRELDAAVQVRTRSVADGGWSAWQSLHTHTDHVPGTGSQRARRALHGSTAPLWVGPSDGVEVRVRMRHGELPRGLRVELVDPGDAPSLDGRGPGDMRRSGLQAAERAGSAHPRQRQGQRQPAWLPELSQEETVADAEARGLTAADRVEDGPHIGPRPGIVTRSGWGADAGLRKGGFLYSKTVKMAFVHHTAMTNDYTCSQAPSVIRGIYRYHVKSSGWRDIGYNFLVDKCGTIYEGRAGGVAEAVQGAHTFGFNQDTMGVAVLGSYGTTEPPRKALDAIAKITAWKLGLYGADPGGSTRITSQGGKFPKGRTVTMKTVSGHRDGFNTDCPGDKLYGSLDSIRALAAELQGR